MSSVPCISEWNQVYGAPSYSYSAERDWWTLHNWQKHLFGFLPSVQSDGSIVDFGCGSAVRIPTLLPQRHHPKYLGIDSSQEAIRVARQNLPQGQFVCADIATYSPQPESADILLCLGLLMYFENYIQILARMLNALKPGGFLLLHEQVRRRSWGGRGNSHPVANGVIFAEIRDFLSQHGLVLHLHFAGSPLRRPMQKLCSSLHLKSLRPLGSCIDAAWCATIGKLIPSIGAGELQIVFRKAT